MKGQGLPISTIIIAALGILVLVVLGAIFSGQIGQFTRASKPCPGRCVVDESKLQDLRLAAHNDRINVDPGLVYQTNSCNREFETDLGSAYTPQNMPKVSDPASWRCQSCCII